MVIIEQTNLYYKQKTQRQTKTLRKKIPFTWENLTLQKFKSFLGILFLIGIIPRENIHDHWSTNPFLRSFIAEYISRDKFYFVWRFLHLNDNNQLERKLETKSYHLLTQLKSNGKSYIPQENDLQ